MAFLGQVDIREKDEMRWELLRPLTYQADRQKFTIPAGFITDLATIPAIFRWLLAPYGKYTKAAILHDYLVRDHIVSLADADGIFRRAMRELNVSFLRRWLMWAAVRIAHGFSGITFRNFLKWLAVAIPAIVFLVAPAIIVLVWLVLFWIFEYIVFAGLRPIRPEKAKRPHILLAADAVKKCK